VTCQRHFHTLGLSEDLTSFCIAMSSSGYKRSRDDEGVDHRRSKREGLPYGEAGGESSDSRPRKPRDWRDAFLNDGERKRHRCVMDRWTPRPTVSLTPSPRDAQSRDHRDSRHRESSVDRDRRRDRDTRHRSERDYNSRHSPQSAKHDRSRSYPENRHNHEREALPKANQALSKEEGE
jgi:hypothetical protein